MATQDLSELGHPKGQMVANVWTRNQGPVATVTALKGLSADIREEGDIRIVTADGSMWRFSAASTLADTTETFVLVPTAGTGRWLRVDKCVDIKMPIAFGTADAAVLFTVPVGMKLLVEQMFWEITTSFAGGSSSAIGASSSATVHSTKGDLLGGATGDVAAAITSTIGITQGTIGVSYSAAPKMVTLSAGETIRFDRITDAFTSGAGFIHAVVRPIP